MTPIEEMSKAIKCLALELPSEVWEDVNKKWQAVVAASRPAESDAVAFQNWIKANNYTQDLDLDGRNPLWFDIMGELVAETTTELYQIFKNSNPRP